MACIVAVTDAASRKILMGTAEGGEIWTVKGHDFTWLLGMDGEPRYRQLCRYALKWPEPKWPEQGGVGISLSQHEKSDDPLYQFLVRDFMKELIQTLDQSHILLKEKDGGASMKGSILLAAKGRLFKIDSYFAVDEINEPYASAGEHWGMARGSLFTTATLGFGAEERIKVALKAAKAEGCKIIEATF